MKLKLILVLITGLLISQNLLADSPLTSTNISDAYPDSKIVQLASKADGRLTIDLIDFLMEDMHPIELKIALINKLGWDSNFSNSTTFYKNLQFVNEFKNKDEFLKNANAGVLICLAYLKAMGNYDDVDEAIIYAKKAKLKNSKSYTINIICALIEAQKASNSSDWDKAKNLMNNVRTNQSLEKDMKQEAIDIIFEYMDS